MEGNVRKKIALKLKEPSTSLSTTSLPATASDAEQQTAGTSSPSLSNSGSSEVSVSVKSKKPPLFQLAQELTWDHPLNLMGRAIMDPLIHVCEVCDRPILIYGRMKKCRHAFCRECAKKAAGECPKCHDSDQTFEESSMGSVHICSHGGGRYDNKGCGRSYLSQRDLDAHIAYRHKTSTTTAASKLPSMQLPHTFFQSPSAHGTVVVPAAAFRSQAIPQLSSAAGGLPPAHPLSLTGFPHQQVSTQGRFPQPGTTATWTRPPGYQ